MIKLINPAYERLPLFQGAAYAFGRARIENEIAQTTLKGPLRAIDHAKSVARGRVPGNLGSIQADSRGHCLRHDHGASPRGIAKAESA